MPGGAPVNPLILDFWFDDENEAEMARHGIRVSQALQVLDGLPRVGRNLRGRRASHIVVGRDSSGACIAIPVEPTHQHGLWRPVTAWYCKPSEWGLL